MATDHAENQQPGWFAQTVEASLGSSPRWRWSTSFSTKGRRWWQQVETRGVQKKMPLAIASEGCRLAP
jgi:hypothetical protein